MATGSALGFYTGGSQARHAPILPHFLRREKLATGELAWTPLDANQVASLSFTRLFDGIGAASFGVWWQGYGRLETICFWVENCEKQAFEGRGRI